MVCYPGLAGGGVGEGTNAFGRELYPDMAETKTGSLIIGLNSQ
jgi:hypothetical protein